MSSQQENPRAASIVDLMRGNPTNHNLWQQLVGTYRVELPENLNITPFAILAFKVTEIHLEAGCDQGLSKGQH